MLRLADAGTARAIVAGLLLLSSLSVDAGDTAAARTAAPQDTVTVPGAASSAEAAAATPFSWTVQRAPDLAAAEQDATRAPVVHQLVGSVHLLPSSAYPLPPGLDQAYARTSALVLETDLAALQEPAFQQQFLQRAQAPGGLRAIVEPALYQRLQQRTAALALPDGYCDAFRAWFCALSLELFELQQAGVDGDFGLDQHYFQRALRDQRSVRWLEEPGQQLALFTTMSDVQSQQFLAATLQGLGEDGADPNELLRQWRLNDQPAMARNVVDLKRRYPDVYDRLLAARNRAWLARLDAMLGESRPLLIVVGAAHLVGPDSVPALLAAQGWIVTPQR